jgi:hypothetical protein
LIEPRLCLVRSNRGNQTSQNSDYRYYCSEDAESAPEAISAVDHSIRFHVRQIGIRQPELNPAPLPSSRRRRGGYLEADGRRAGTPTQGH